MKKTLLITLIALFSLFTWLPAANEYSGGINWTRAQQHQTNNTTWTPVASTAIANTLIMNVSNAGTSWIITVKNKEGTAKTLWSGTAAVGTVTILALPVGIEMTNGIDVTFSGTAGVADFFLVYR